jgi:hypothetical protein
MLLNPGGELMRCDKQQLIYTAFAALNIISIHSPTAAMFNYLLWGYILPQRVKNRMEQSYA